MSRIVIVDDEPDLTTALGEFLRIHGHAVTTANTVATARDVLADRIPDALILDLMLPDGSGLEVLESFGDKRPQRIVFITGHTGIKSLIGDMAGDGVSYLTKPIEPNDLLGILNTLSDAEQVPRDDDVERHFGSLVGDSAAMHDVYQKIRQVAATDSTVFVQGESGTGKELVAAALHAESGRKGKFVPVNCGGLAHDLVSSQLFGHEKGSFTGATTRHTGFFERAADGTLFLDEITEMPLEMQTHLLRVLETGKILRLGAETEIDVNARLIAATNRDPVSAIDDDKLREDLYFRLRVFPIQLPPLRDRQGDAELLARTFLNDLNEKHGTEKAFADGWVEQVETHDWPGNVRELKHTVHRAYILADDGHLDIGSAFEDDVPSNVEGLRVGRSIADVEKDLVLATLEHYGGDKKKAASSLGISLKTLYNRLKDYETGS